MYQMFIFNPSVTPKESLSSSLLCGSDRMIDDYVSLCDGFLFCGGEDITPLLFGEEPQTEMKTDIDGRLFQIRLKRRVRLPEICPCNLQRNADFKCFLRRNNLAGSFPYPTADAQPHTAVRIQRRCQPPHQNRTLLKAQTICRLVHLCEQFPPSICQNTREKRLCQRPFLTDGALLRHRTFRTSFRPRSSTPAS